jgi:hypothetical protein
MSCAIWSVSKVRVFGMLLELAPVDMAKVTLLGVCGGAGVSGVVGLEGFSGVTGLAGLCGPSSIASPSSLKLIGSTSASSSCN